MAKLSDTDNQPNTIPPKILDEADGIALNGLTFATLSRCNDKGLILPNKDQSIKSSRVTEFPITTDTHFSTNGVYSIPIKNTSSCPIDTSFCEHPSLPRDAQENEMIQKKLEKIFKEICVITDKIRKEVY